MYDVNVSIKGVSPILQHRFAPDILENLLEGATKKTVTKDYSTEWLTTLYSTTDGYLYQPGAHIEGALVKAAARFSAKGTGGGGKRTYKDPVRAYVSVQPEQVIHFWCNEPVATPSETLLHNPQQHLEVSIMRVTVNRAAVARLRLQINEGWELNFRLHVIEDLQPNVLRDILIEAGRAVGIGDFRPKYGRFEVAAFDVVT